MTERLAAAAPPWAGPTILDDLHRCAREAPDRAALTEGERTFTWAELEAEVARVARALDDAGAGFGDRVILYLDRKSAHIIAYLAVTSVGGISVHVYPERSWSYIEFAAAAVGASLVVTLAPVPEGFDACPVLTYPKDDQALRPLRLARRHPIAYLMFTSGTTSTPKAVITNHGNVTAVTRALIDAAAMRAGDRELVFMPLGSTGGAGHLHAALSLGNHLRLLPWFMAEVGDDELEELIWRIEAEDITGLLATPRLVARLMSHHREAWGRAGRRLRYLLANVTPMRREVIVDLLELLPQLRFVTYYGLTEASRSVINVCRHSPGAEHASGRPAPGVEVRILDPDPQTGIGEIGLRGPNVAEGYWDGTSCLGADGVFRTGDWGRRDDGGLIYALGRIRETISVDGLKVFPSAIEALISPHPEVAECAAVALPDDATYQRIGVAVVLKDPAAPDARRDATARQLLAACEAHLASFQVPRGIYILPELPRTDLGKLRRGALVERLLGGAAGLSWPRPPASPSRRLP